MTTVKTSHDLSTSLRRRQQAGLSQRKLARLSGIGHSTLRRIEDRRATAARPATLRAVEAALSKAEELPASNTLPPLLPYLRARYPDMPERLVHQITDYFDYLTSRYGSPGPVDRADER